MLGRVEEPDGADDAVAGLDQVIQDVKLAVPFRRRGSDSTVAHSSRSSQLGTGDHSVSDSTP
jgi:hypothetical protein